MNSEAVLLDYRLYQGGRSLRMGGWNGLDEDVDDRGALLRYYEVTITLTFKCKAQFMSKVAHAALLLLSFEAHGDYLRRRR